MSEISFFIDLIQNTNIPIVGIVIQLEFREIYCNNCKKVLGRYNIKYYSEAKIAELIRNSHALHVRNGHHLDIRKIKK